MLCVQRLTGGKCGKLAWARSITVKCLVCTRSLSPKFLFRQVRNVRRHGVLPAAVGMGCCAQHRAEQRRQHDAGELEGVVPCVQQAHGNSAIR
jgi:hypothetical protein